MRIQLAVCIVTGTLLAGCGEDKVEHYQVARVERKVEMPKPQMQQMPGLAAQTERFKTPDWVVPEGWEPQPLGTMRKGSFLVKTDSGKAEMTVLAFPGDVGGLLANINRWAGQIDAPDLEDVDLERLKRTEVDGLEGIWVDLKGPAQQVLGVVVMRDGDSWFFKMMGDSDIIEAQREPFAAFMESVKFN